MKSHFKKFREKGFSVIEVILAAALFMILATGSIVVILQGLDSNRLGEEQTVANQYAAEGMEAVRSIKNQGFINLVNSAGTGIARVGNVWTFSGVNNTFTPNPNKTYTRVLKVESVNRDAVPPAGNIVPAPTGTLDLNTIKVTSTVSWNFNSARPESVQLTEYMTNWKSQKGGMVVYGNGGTTTNAVSYRIFDGAAGTWNTTAATGTVGQSAAAALRTVRIYSSSSRNEKIAISRHYDISGTTQSIYAQVFNGTTWGNVVQLAAPWSTSTFLDVQNFDGTYLSNGNFMVVYSNNTTTPQSQIWNGTSWSAGSAMTTLGASQIPNFIVASARPGSNEVMAAFFTRGASATAANTITQYYNGTTWSAITSHGTLSITNTKRMVDFVWSGNTPTIGALVFSNSTTDKQIRVRTGTASGGVFTWGTTGLSTAQTNNLGALSIAARPNTVNQFVACDKDSLATPLIICYQVTHAATPTFSGATTIAAATDTGIERSFHIAYKSIATSGNIGIAVYSNNTATPQFRSFTSTPAWNAITPIPTTGFTPGIFKAIRLIPQNQGDDIMAMMADANRGLYSVVYNASIDDVYKLAGDPAGKKFSQHGLNGSAITDFWFDFAWDQF